VCPCRFRSSIDGNRPGVDNQVAYLDFVGQFGDGGMVLPRHALNQKGQEVLQRMVCKNPKADRLDWSWEQSTDAGKTRVVLWPIHYTRRK
jgi:hypothetical protein